MAEQRTIRQWSAFKIAQILLLLTVLGTASGIFMVYSASYPLSLARTGNAFYFTFRQIAYAVVGFVLLMIAWKVPLQWLKRWGWVLHLFTMVLLTLTLIFGKKVGEAQRWIDFGPLQIQPSEFAKVTLIVCLAALTARWRGAKGAGEKFRLWVTIFLFWALTVFLVLKQPHLSGGALLAFIGLAAMFFARLPLSALLAIVFLAAGAGYFGQKHFLHHYQWERWQIGSWLSLPKEKPDEQKSYQVRQALLGLQVGGWSGRGFFQSRQKHLFLPSAHNDFIFAVIGEETGLIGTSIALAFFAGLAYLGLWVASQSQDPFASGVAGGVAIWIWAQAVMHIAVNTNLLPPTGVPLPFFSVGGSALCATLLGMGLLLNVATELIHKQKRRGGTKDGLGDGRRGDRGTYLSSPRPRSRRQIHLT